MELAQNFLSGNFFENHYQLIHNTLLSSLWFQGLAQNRRFEPCCLVLKEINKKLAYSH